MLKDEINEFNLIKKIKFLLKKLNLRSKKKPEATLFI
jgi:hypothetical protein